MNEKRASELARLSLGELKRYRRLKAIAITLGLISLFSFWIMVGLNEILPWNGPTYSMGSLVRLYEWSPWGLLIALIALVMSFGLKASAREIREGSDPAKQQQPR